MIDPLRYTQVSTWMNHWRGELFKVFRETCPFCGTRLRQRYDESGLADYFNEEFSWESWACLACGWWWEGTLPAHSWSIGSTEAGVIHKTSDLPKPLAEGLAEIRSNSTKLFQMHPTKFEQFVGDILSEFYACQVVHCGKSHDGGIDLLLIDSDVGPIPIQVKRRSKPGSVESVRLVREFRGAMLIAGHDSGKIVTTADHFSKEAIDSSMPGPEHLIAQTIDLIDCRRLLDIMNILSSREGEHLWHLCKLGALGGSVQPQSDVRLRIQASINNFARVALKGREFEA